MCILVFKVKLHIYFQNLILKIKNLLEDGRKVKKLI